MQNDLERLAVKSKAITRYGTIDRIWSEGDAWHLHTRVAIQRFIADASRYVQMGQDAQILNVGSAGEDYNFFPDNQVHIDIVDKFIKFKSRFVVADAESLPFPDQSVHAVMCVGSVLNYCSAFEVIEEFRRVLKPDGFLILDFETSTSLEFLGTAIFGRDVSIVNTFYQEHTEKIWVYSPPYIDRLLRRGGFQSKRNQNIHIVSPLGLKLGLPVAAAARWARFDRYASAIPWIGRRGCNVILFCQKDVLKDP